MHSVSHPAVAALVLTMLTVTSPAPAERLSAVHRQQYAMGTMFDIVVYHGSPDAAARAVEQALAEVLRLDDVLSNYKTGSELSKLNREGRRGTVRVDPSLFEVVAQSVAFSKQTAGTFDVTIAPVLRVWKAAAAQSRRPAAAAIEDARRCVGSEKIVIVPPDRIGFRSDCLEIDLGGIGKGYAVDRALGVLKSAGIGNALVNAGSSSIAAIGAPPGRRGWPVLLGAAVSGRSILLLEGNSLSTSQQDPASDFGDIIDPDRGAPVGSRSSVTVVAPTATLSDALSTAAVIFGRDRAGHLLEQFAGVSALWISPRGELQAGYRQSVLDLADGR